MALTGATPTNYSNSATGRLAAKVTATQTASILVTADTYKTPAGSAPVTFPTGEMILKLTRKTRTETQIEFIGVESGTSQTAAAVTLGTCLRYMSPTNGALFTSVSSTGLSFPAGTIVELVWGIHQAENAVFKNNTTTVTGALRGSGTTFATFRDNSVTTAQKNAITGADGDWLFDSDLGAPFYWGGGTWNQVGNTGTSNASTTVAGKVEEAILSEVSAGTAAGGTGARLFINPSLVKKTSSGAAEGNVVALNSATMLDGSIGGVGLATPVLGALLIGGGAGLAMTAIGPGSSGQVPVSNGTTLAMGSPTVTRKCVYASGTSSTALANPTSITAYNTHTYTIPANDLVAGVSYDFECGITYTTGTSMTVTWGVMLGSTKIAQVSITGLNGASTAMIRGTIMGTAGAGASVAVRGVVFAGAHENLGATRAQYETANVATNGTLALQFGCFFGTSDAGNTTTMVLAKMSKESATAFS